MATFDGEGDIKEVFYKGFVGQGRWTFVMALAYMFGTFHNSVIMTFFEFVTNYFSLVETSLSLKMFMN